MSAKYMFAISADAALTAALVRVYGRALAADMRYRPDEWTDEALIAAGITKRNADEAHLTEMRANRAEIRDMEDGHAGKRGNL